MPLTDRILKQIDDIRMSGPDPFPDETIAIQCHPGVWHAILKSADGEYIQSPIGPVLVRHRPGMKYLGPWPVRLNPLMAAGAVSIGVHHFRVLAHFQLEDLT